jgi:hypothetical protein
VTRPARRPLVLVLALVAAFGGFAGYQLAPCRESPRRAWEAITGAAASGDYGAVWDRFDPASQQRMGERLRRYAAEAAPDRTAGMTDRERFGLLLGREADVRAQFRPADVLSVSGGRDRCSLEIDRPDPTRGPVPTPTSHVYLTFHVGRWRLSYGAPAPE